MCRTCRIITSEDGRHHRTFLKSFDNSNELFSLQHDFVGGPKTTCPPEVPVNMPWKELYTDRNVLLSDSPTVAPSAPGSVVSELETLSAMMDNAETTPFNYNDDSLSWMVEALADDHLTTSGWSGLQHIAVPVEEQPLQAVLKQYSTTSDKKPSHVQSEQHAMMLLQNEHSPIGSTVCRTLPHKKQPTRLHAVNQRVKLLLNTANLIRACTPDSPIMIQAGVLTVNIPSELRALVAAKGGGSCETTGSLFVAPPLKRTSHSCGKAAIAADALRIKKLSRVQVLQEILVRTSSSNMKELDTIISSFIAAYAKILTTVQLRQLLHVLNAVPKHRLFSWLSGQEALPSRRLSPLNSFSDDESIVASSTTLLPVEERRSKLTTLSSHSSSAVLSNAPSVPSPAERAIEWERYFVAGQMLLGYLNVNHPYLRRFERRLLPKARLLLRRSCSSLPCGGLSREN